jgi:hypothetical protein
VLAHVREARQATSGMDAHARVGAMSVPALPGESAHAKACALRS